MFRKKTVVIGAIMLALTLAACMAQAPEPVATSDTVSHGNEIGGYVELVDTLRAAGATVEPAGDIEQPFFNVSGYIIEVEGTEVQVFEYPDEIARQAESDLISPDGFSIGTTMVSWVDQPNFWFKGRVVVLYVGTDAAMQRLLSGVLGEPITDHAVIRNPPEPTLPLAQDTKCETHTAAMTLSTTATALKAGEVVTVTVTLTNQGCVDLGMPQYRLYVQSDEAHRVFDPDKPEPVVHYLGVAPGGSDTAEFVLRAVGPGQATFSASASFEVHLGYPGPAYWGGSGAGPLEITVTP